MNAGIKRTGDGETILLTRVAKWLLTKSESVVIETFPLAQLPENIGGQGRNRTNDTRIFSPCSKTYYVVDGTSKISSAVPNISPRFGHLTC